MIRSAFAAYSPGQPEAVPAHLPTVPAARPAQLAPAIATSVADWDLLFCAVTERLRTYAATGLPPSGSAHETAKATLQLLSLDCALALELLQAMLSEGRPGGAASARTRDDESN